MATGFVDRLWPRGVSKETAQIYLWLKEIAPSYVLRNWFGHDPELWEEFRAKYHNELANRKELLKLLKTLESEHKAITLVYASKDDTHNNALVLKQALESMG